MWPMVRENQPRAGLGVEAEQLMVKEGSTILPPPYNLQTSQDMDQSRIVHLVRVHPWMAAPPGSICTAWPDVKFDSPFSISRGCTSLSGIRGTEFVLPVAPQYRKNTKRRLQREKTIPFPFSSMDWIVEMALQH